MQISNGTIYSYDFDTQEELDKLMIGLMKGMFGSGVPELRCIDEIIDGLEGNNEFTLGSPKIKKSIKKRLENIISRGDIRDFVTEHNHFRRVPEFKELFEGIQKLNSLYILTSRIPKNDMGYFSNITIAHIPHQETSLWLLGRKFDYSSDTPLRETRNPSYVLSKDFNSNDDKILEHRRKIGEGHQVEWLNNYKPANASKIEAKLTNLIAPKDKLNGASFITGAVAKPSFL